MKSKYSGAVKGPRPLEVHKLCLDDHSVPILYWKAWRAREIVKEVLMEALLCSQLSCTRWQKQTQVL